MENGVNSYRSVIEHFLLMHESSNADRLVYYDQTGHKFEKSVARGIVDTALKKFDGSPKAVARSSGGLIRAVPHQLVVFDQTNRHGQVVPEVRIQVKFRDFKRDARGEIIPTETVLRTKIIECEQVVDLFDIRITDDQRFLVDLGRGVVPVYVFRYGMESNGRVNALFVELSDLEKCTFTCPTPFLTRVQLYKIERDLLRHAGPNSLGLAGDWERAVANYRAQLKAGYPAIPKALELGGTVACPTNLAPAEFRRHLTLELQHQKSLKLDVPTRTFEATGSDELVPFEENL